MIAQALTDFALRAPKGADRSGLGAGVTRLLRWNWIRLQDESRRLLASAPCVLPALPINIVRALHAGMLGALEVGRYWCAKFLNLYCHSPQQKSTVRELRIGLGSPGYHGCVTLDGGAVVWPKFTDPCTGVFCAMDSLDLLILGMPGARLHENFKLPASCGKYCVSRGGPSYDSCAAVVSNALGNVAQHLSEMGSCRRLWFRIQCDEGSVLHLCFFYLHTGSAPVDVWTAELNGLDEDLRSLAGAGVSSGILLMGDANVQPSRLGGGPDPNGARDSRLEAFLSKWELLLLNPSVGGCSRQQVALPLRGKDIQIRTGDTHHFHGESSSRSIDLVWASADLLAQLVIHNSLHCQPDGTPCPFNNCIEYTRGDHFLLELRVGLGVEIDVGHAGARLPHWWESAVGWKHGLTAAGDVMESISDLLCRTCCSEDGVAACRSMARPAAQWFTDAVGWLLLVIVAISCDGWVLPRPGWRAQIKYAKIPAAIESDSLLSRIAAAAQAGLAPRALLHKCHRWLKPADPKPPQRLLVNGVLADETGTHKAWCEQVESQRAWPHPWDMQYDAEVRTKVKSMLGTAWKKRGSGLFDSLVDQSEVQRVLSEWDSSSATNPDFFPRSALKMGLDKCDRMVWLSQRLVGTGCLALRPCLWRARLMCPKYKGGLPLLADNWRQLEICSQFGLLQESIVVERVKPTVRPYVLQCQSGYVRDVADAHLLGHEFIAAALGQGRPLWCVPADVWKAFPRMWREDFMDLLMTGPRVRDGAAALIGSILEWDDVIVPLGGCSSVKVIQGVPEGGKLGPLGFNLLPDSLARMFDDAGLGVGLGIVIPPAWAEHKWIGTGTPIPPLVEVLVKGLQGSLLLPPADLLAKSADLEASALRALDVVAPLRASVVLHADDPFFLASSWGAMQELLRITAAWAYMHKVALHLGDKKTVVMRTAGIGCGCPPTSFSPVGLHLVTLSERQQHKWLGLQWRVDLNLLPALKTRVAQVDGLVASLAGMVACQSLPLAMAVDMFESRVDGSLRFGRWLLVTADGARELLDRAFENWSRALVGSHFWRSGVIAGGELGWYVGGFMRGLLDMAKRRARLFCLPDGDFYKRVFLEAHGCRGLTWANKSKALLAEFGLPDFPAWSDSGGSYANYGGHLLEVLRSRHEEVWLAAARKHRAPVPYLTIMPGISDRLSRGLTLPCSWSELLNQGLAARLRCGLVELGHRNNVRTRARTQSCVFCQRSTSHLWAHVFGECTCWESIRISTAAAMGVPDDIRSWDLMFAIVSAKPGVPGYMQSLEYVRKIVLGADSFWRHDGDS